MEAQAFDALVGMLLTPVNLAIMVAAWFVIALSRKMLPELYKKPIMVRLLPLFPMLLCIGFVWLPGVGPAEASWGWRLILGIVLGWGVGHLHKVLKQTVLGQDTFLNGNKEGPKENNE